MPNKEEDDGGYKDQSGYDWYKGYKGYGGKEEVWHEVISEDVYFHNFESPKGKAKNI